jgi:hypothetical protein
VGNGIDINNRGGGGFDLISAFEVFEHVNIRSGRRLDWWYASLRNGHISLYSRKKAAFRRSRRTSS